MNLDLDLGPDLVRLGDDLEIAIAAQLSTAGPGPAVEPSAGSESVPAPGHSWWRRRRVLVPAVAAVIVAAGGAAAATGVFGPKEVATGMTETALIFAGTTAHCTTSDNVVFHCTLSDTPHGESGVSYVKGALYEYAVANVVAGGCRGEDAEGLTWTCYAGQAAVDHGVIGPGLLGEVLPAGVHPRG